MFDERNEILKKIEEHNDTVYLTIGYRWKNPTTLDKPMTVRQAAQFVKETGYFMELKERDGKLCLQCYTANDMW